MVTNGGRIPADDMPRKGMVLLVGGSAELGIDEADLELLVEMGRKVPHMSLTQAKWWFGDEIPKHVVDVEPFHMDTYEVTNAQFGQFADETGYQAQGKWEKYAKAHRMNHPVVNVSWHDANAYCRWAGKRLPTEAEWEYAAKGGSRSKWFPWGDAPDATQAHYRHQGESFLEGIPKLLGLRKINTKPVGSYGANGYGLFDMIGNVSEWCQNARMPYPGGPEEDWIYKRHGPYKKDAKPVFGKAVRGGSWNSPNPVFIRLTCRNGFEPHTFSYSRGFRCARSVPSARLNPTRQSDH